MDLSNLAAKNNDLDGFGLFGVVKETAVDDEGLAEFQSKYFNYPLYRDADMEFYNALGGRKVGVSSWNPISWFRSIRSMGKRFKAKGIDGNMKGDGIVQGGVIIFGKDGNPKYAYEEKTGKELPVADILAAVNDVRSAK